MTEGASTSSRRTWLVALAGLVAFALVGIAATQLLIVALFGIALGVNPALADWARDPWRGGMVLGGVAMLGGFLLATWILSRTLLRTSAEELRWRGSGPRLPGFLGAFGLGVLLAAVVLALGVLLGDADWERGSGGLAGYAGRIVELAVMLAPAAMAEEVIFRGLPLVALAGLAGRFRAAVITSIIFAGAHWINPSASPLGLLNIGIAGLWLAAAFYAPGGIWTAFGGHLGWNWMLVALDAPVSGVDLSTPMIDYFPGGPIWLTGGRFGPEGGLAATLGFLAGAAAIIWYVRSRPPVEQADGPTT